MQRNNYLNILIISGGGLIAGAINYIYHPVMLKFLTLEEFGIFATLMGLFNLLGAILGGVSLYFNKLVSSKGSDFSTIKGILYTTSPYLFIVGVCVYLLYAVMSPFISQSLNISISLILLSGLGISYSFVAALVDAMFKGMKKFLYIPIHSIAGALFRLTIGVSLVFLGYKIVGAVLGVLLSSFILFIVFGYYLLYTLRAYPPKYSEVKGIPIGAKKEILHFFIVSLCFSILFNGDIILVKALFPEQIAGIYGGISVLGKFLVFLLLSIETVYYSNIMEHSKEKLPYELLRNPLVLISITSLCAIAVNIYVGEFVLSLLKSELSAYKYLYLLTLIYYSFIVLISFSAKILIGWKHYQANYILLSGIACIGIFEGMYGRESIEVFVYILIVGSAFIGVSLTTMLVYASLYHKRFPKIITPTND